MNKKEREACRLRAEARQHARRDARGTKEKLGAQKAAARRALESHHAGWDEKKLQRFAAEPRAFIQTLLEGPGRKLVCAETETALCRLGQVRHLRSAKDWKVRGKGRGSVFRSLCEHLLAKYPMPSFLWSAFEDRSDQNAALLVPLVVHMAGGGSLFQFCKDGRVPFTLTRAQCHDFIRTPSDVGVLSAVRRVQVKAEGGDHHLYEVWRNIEHNRRLGSADEESFNVGVLRFFARNPMLDRAQIAPLCDYILRRFQETPGFSMQGRTATALLRDMDQWHRDLQHDSAGRRAALEPSVKFARSGFQGYRVEKDDTRAVRNGFSNVQVWTIEEITSSDALREEGRALHHCAYSYRSQISSGSTSIWSLSMRDDFTELEKLALGKWRSCGARRTEIGSRWRWSW